ncbi:Naphthalene 1,2-dioxygenase/salicylate 5-hydroxylase systems, ferredoxin component [bacterium HR21]|jgi:3-phenylpropionate/trans-cinnamate dioxygenase ferredoxin subunit|nr:Naphthalene 1,2-dioxygenase/salicylate 5-hydroxylase systems, ferredoxin component [bacterium HR21]
MSLRAFRPGDEAPELERQGKRLVQVCPLEALPVGAVAVVHFDGEDVALVHCREGLFALSNRCAHQHVSVLAAGSLEGLSLRCPRHGWRYDLRTGKALEGSGCLPVYEVQCHKGWIYVERPAEGKPWG